MQVPLLGHAGEDDEEGVGGFMATTPKRFAFTPKPPPSFSLPGSDEFGLGGDGEGSDESGTRSPSPPLRLALSTRMKRVGAWAVLVYGLTLTVLGTTFTVLPWFGIADE